MTTPDYAGLIESLDHRASTMNGAEPVGAGDGHTYVTGYYTVSDRTLDREAATALRTLLERNAALERERDELKHDVSRYVEIASDEATRAEAAEAQLAEANKALEAFINRIPAAAWKLPDGALVAKTGIEIEYFRAARRALTGGQEE